MDQSLDISVDFPVPVSPEDMKSAGCFDRWVMPVTAQYLSLEGENPHDFCMDLMWGSSCHDEPQKSLYGFSRNPSSYWAIPGIFLTMEQDGAPQICERWFINHEITPMKL